VEHITPEFHGRLRKSQLKAGDVLVVRVGANRGDGCEVPAGIHEMNCANVVFARPIHPTGFLSLFLRSDYGRQSMLSLSTGAAQGVINTGAIAALPVPVPPADVQRRIVQVLSAYDDLMENNLRRIQILEEMAQALYREWFVEFRFPGHEGHDLMVSPEGLVPEGWQTVELEKIASLNEVSLKPKSAPDEISYVPIKSVSTGRIDSSEQMAFTDAPGRARRVVRHGDTIWSNVRPNLRAYALVLDPIENLVVSTGFSVVSPKAVPYSFLFQALTTDRFVSYLVNHATGAAYPAVGQGDFNEARLLVPPSDLLDRFHGVAEPMLVMVERLLEENRVLARTRDLLLPRLISGELDVSQLDIEVVEAA